MHSDTPQGTTSGLPTPTQRPDAAVVIYDGNCRFCTAQVRRLKRRDSSYRALLDETRMACANELLQRAQLTVADVGEKLGYSDPANFGRAFRKLRGVTPAAWRRGRTSSAASWR